MYTHLITENAHDQLSRAKRAIGTLSLLLMSYGEAQSGMVDSQDVACLLDYIWKDISAGLEGCEERSRPSSATVEPLRVI
ncbi:hypothetical protein C5E22_11720 [Pectobacterium parmentieri]|uniref:hypothetical protein n=1 Tax=Pectobacterium TaxID=122277 RepID=UPI000EABD498|nr:MULTISPECIES: hypothetical protein [Pectobacterium]AYH10184.1 hypothetical protein C5E24_11070 [Pectobacterium parmentieri]AYH19105.1 hypothetical protein C5E22_11720 [Pectobacterium parmentieri]AZS56609.1 hypothetical protein C5E18_11015 [Pectobacterium parmentieri]MBQ4779052.1 hypothetical protein [Pectobacterium versatile]MBQ4783452.1 hypothetical protein [Pectobacterium versatile]